MTRRTPPEDPRDRRAARGAATGLLARRDHSRAELSGRLLARGFDPHVVAAVLDELAAEHLLDEARFAENYVAYHASRGQGPVRIAADLRSLGLPAELIDAALGRGPDWEAAARRARARKFGSTEPRSFGERGRQARFLQYRGFSSDHIRLALGPDLTPEE